MLVVLVVAVRTCDMDRNNVDRLLCCLCPLAINMVAVKASSKTKHLQLLGILE